MLTLMEICETCSFSSLAYFSKYFSFWHGKTPVQYRKDLPDCTRKHRRSFSESEGTDLLLKLNDSYQIINHSPQKTFSTFASLQVDFLQSAGCLFTKPILAASHCSAMVSKRFLAKISRSGNFWGHRLSPLFPARASRYGSIFGPSKGKDDRIQPHTHSAPFCQAGTLSIRWFTP